MTISTALDRLIARQQALIEALDSRDADAINCATASLAEAVEQCRQMDSWHPQPEQQRQLDHALRQSDAARIRVNVLTDWTRQRIDQLHELRSGTQASTYTKY